MSAIDPANDAAAATANAASTQVVCFAHATEDAVAPDDWKADEETLRRIEHLPRDVGWMLVYVGVLGVVLPGIIGTPFLVAGAAVLLPGGPERLSRWVGKKPRPVVHASMKQIGRMLDDLERRYPRLP